MSNLNAFSTNGSEDITSLFTSFLGGNHGKCTGMAQCQKYMGRMFPARRSYITLNNLLKLVFLNLKNNNKKQSKSP